MEWRRNESGDGKPGAEDAPGLQGALRRATDGAGAGMGLAVRARLRRRARRRAAGVSVVLLALAAGAWSATSWLGPVDSLEDSGSAGPVAEQGGGGGLPVPSEDEPVQAATVEAEEGAPVRDSGPPEIETPTAAGESFPFGMDFGRERLPSAEVRARLIALAEEHGIETLLVRLSSRGLEHAATGSFGASASLPTPAIRERVRELLAGYDAAHIEVRGGAVSSFSVQVWPERPRKRPGRLSPGD